MDAQAGLGLCCLNAKVRFSRDKKHILSWFSLNKTGQTFETALLVAQFGTICLLKLFVYLSDKVLTL